jgi:aldehyde oxidoreductase
VTAIDTNVVTFTVNGSAVSVRGDHPHLLAALREELDLTAAKDGCSPTGQCGCCTVLVDGKAQVSCQYPVAKAAGRLVVTVEGLPSEERDRFAAAFAACGGLQCGFCIPGIVVRAKAQIDKKGAALTREEMARHLGAHLCRCTGYVKILDAIEMVARSAVPDVVAVAGGVGASGGRYQAQELTLGDRGYIDDIRIPAMLHGALHLAAHARAVVRAISTGAALAAPGVVAVYTAADVPGELRVGIIYKDWPVFIPVGGQTSYLGDVLAVVVADTRDHARAAAELVSVEYEVLTPVTDPAAAVFVAGGPVAVWGTDSNVLSRSVYRRGGDVDLELASSAHVVHQVFQTQRVEQAFLEPEATVAVPVPVSPPVTGASVSAPVTGASAPVTGASVSGERRLHVYSGGQGVWDDRDQIASVLGVSHDTVTVELVSNGGAFGGKEDMANQAQTALAAWLLGQPVKCTLSRHESLLIHAKRHPVRAEYWAGCDQSGRLTALKCRLLGDSGAYASVGMKVMERAAGHASGPYRVPTIDVESIAARTNNPICGAFRGFGANQAQFAMEGVLDRLASLVGISGWEIRKRNVIRPGQVWGPGQVMDDGCLGAEQCLDHIRPAYEAASEDPAKAVGLGLGLKNSGLGNGFKELTRAVVRFQPDGTIEVRHGWTEMGQGVHTVALQVAVEELGIDPGRVRVLVDTTRELGFGQTTGSRGTLMGAGAVKDACRAALVGGCQVGVDYVGEYRVDWTNSLSEGLEHPVIHSAFGYAAQMVIMDRETGAIDKVVAVHDVGRAVNPQLCEGQIEGAVHMGLGYALTEDFPADASGQPQNMTLRSLDILRPKDVPPIEVVLVEAAQPGSPYGIKGVGEIGLVPTAGAVAAALHDLDGTWRDTLPMKPRGSRPAPAGRAASGD